MSTEIKQEEKQGTNKGLLIFLLLLVLTLGGICFYLFSELGKSKNLAIEASQVNEQKDDEIDGLLYQLDEKEAEYNRIIEEKKQLGYDVSDLEQEREALLEDIKTWKAKAKSSNRDVKQLKKKLELKNAQYTVELAEKDQEISLLRTANDSLNTTSQELNQQKQVQASIIEAQNEKIKLGSILKAENLKITMKDAKQKATEKQPFKGKKMETVILNFNIAENNVASYNKKEISMRLVGPDGAVLYDLASGGGSLKTANDETIFYTLKQNLLFDNTKQAMTFPYYKGNEWTAGSYEIQIYGDGYLIGKTKFDVK